MVLLILFLDVAQNLQRLFRGSRVYYHLLESSFQSSVLLDALAIFVQGGGSDTLQGASCQGWFQDVCRIHRSLGASGSNHRVNLVDEEDDVLVAFQFSDDALDALLKLSSVFGSGYESGKVEAHDSLVEEE